MSEFAILGTERGRASTGGWNMPNTWLTEILAIIVLPRQAPCGEGAIKSDSG